MKLNEIMQHQPPRPAPPPPPPPPHPTQPQLPLLPPVPLRPGGVTLAAAPRRPRAPSASHSRRSPVEGTFCSYSHRVCMQNRLDGYEFCIKHILEDKSSPFRQCNYVSQTGKRCPNATPKADKKNDGYCQEHASRLSMVKQRALRKRKPKETPETLLADLDHYTSQEQKRPLSVASRALEYAVSSSDSEAEPALVDQAWRGDGDSDAESVDSEQEDPLKHAGVYTSEEVALITRDKLIRLQSLYIDQFKRLQHLLKEKRRRYLHTVRAERERLGSVGYAKEDPEQREYYDMLQSMKRYHRRFGTEALLQRQSKERRIQVSEGLHYRPPAYPKCVHASPSSSAPASKCSERAVPLSKYCKMHIACDDVHQVLYKTCGYGGEDACTVPVPALAPDRRCYLHAQLASHIPARLPAKNSRHSSSEEEDDDDEKDMSVDVTTVDAPKQDAPQNSLRSVAPSATFTSSQSSHTASSSAPAPAPASTPAQAPSSTFIQASSQAPKFQGAVQAPKTTIQGSIQAPMNTQGSVQAPKSTIQGSIQAPMSTIQGSIQAPMNTQGSIQASKSTIHGSIQAPMNTQGSMQAPMSTQGFVQAPKSTIQGSIQAPTTSQGSVQAPKSTIQGPSTSTYSGPAKDCAPVETPVSAASTSDGGAPRGENRT